MSDAATSSPSAPSGFYDGGLRRLEEGAVMFLLLAVVLLSGAEIVVRNLGIEWIDIVPMQLATYFLSFHLGLFGAGLAAGNLLGGKLADRGVLRALTWSLVALLVVLALGRWAFGHPGVAMAYVVVLGVMAFATVAPMQMRVLDQAGPHGANLVSSLNIAAFNLGNALGAWAGGLALAGGLGLVHLGWVAAALTAVGLLLTVWSRYLPVRHPVPQTCDLARA